MHYPLNLSLIVLLTCSTFIQASDLPDTDREREIKHTGEYKWGEGIDTDPLKAREAAMRDLIQKIQVSISLRTGRRLTETESMLKDSATVITDVYSALHLQNLGILEFPEKGKVRVIAYIDTASLTKSFEVSKRKVQDMVSLARKAEEEGRIGDALRNYYWAYLLTHSYIGELEIGFEGIGYADAQIVLVEQIELVVARLNAKAETCYRAAGSIEAPVRFFYSGKPVRNLDFSYYCGDGDDIITVEDGSPAYIRLYFEPPRRWHRLPFRIEYAYAGDMRRNPEIEDLYRIFKDKTFDNGMDVRLTLPWNEEGSTWPPAELETLPKPTPHRWSVTIEVLSQITDSREFRQALRDYVQVGRVNIASEHEQLQACQAVYAALLDNDKVHALLFYDEDRYIDVRSGKSYISYTEAFTGEVSLIWIGELPE